MNRNGKLRIGIVGAGGIVQKRHLPALRKRADVEVVAVSNSTYESSEKFCRENVPSAVPMTNWPELVALPDIDVIWIGTPPYMHSAVTISALEAGKHVFCQARMANDRAEAEEMLATSRRFPHQVTMLCPPPFGLRGDRVVKNMLAENFLGELHTIRLQSFHGKYLDASAPAHWRQRIEISGLNVLTLGIYVEVLQRWFGDIDGLFARGKILYPNRDGYNVIIPDALNVLCHFANGAEGVLEFSGIHAHATGDRLEVYGSAGTLVYDFTADKLSAARTGDHELSEVEIPKKLERDWTVEDDFLDAVKAGNGERPHPTFEDGVRYMRVVQGVANSRAGNEWVGIN
ncbi:MAG: Gfo/Idh/MocA family oxidoreductase [Verrucomicrobia bacterium]|nr:Gfo/Idh/MocA family oxidoreductase [Verrucomicrobiota bacterium]